MDPAELLAFSVDDDLNEPLGASAAAELRAVLGFPAPVAAPAMRPGEEPAREPELDAERESESESEREPASVATEPSAAPDAALRSLGEELARVSERLARLESRYADPSALLEEIDRKLEKLLDASRHVQAAAHTDTPRISVRDVQLDDLRMQIHDLRSSVNRIAKMLFG